ELRRGFASLEVVQKDPSIPVYHIYLNRPAQRNALNLSFFSDLPRALSRLSVLPSARAVVLAARGPHFCSGIDLSALNHLSLSPLNPDPAASAVLLRQRIVPSRPPSPPSSAAASPSSPPSRRLRRGGGSWIPPAPARIVGYGNATDLALTGRRISAEEAKGMGLVSRVSIPDGSRRGVDLIARVISFLDLIVGLAEKSAVAVIGTKAVLLRAERPDGGGWARLRCHVELGHAYVT
ncbi:hypothetical protein HPP92_028086, partial [Vanilla planifolia]